MQNYETFCKWYKKTYGRTFSATKEQFEAAMHQKVTFAAEETTNDNVQFDYDTERREGW